MTESGNGAPFRFPSRGFFIVEDKVAEADYFLEKMRRDVGHLHFGFLFSAFVSAARSITFALQAVMEPYPGFADWYSQRRETLRSSELSAFFVRARNHAQKVGSLPLRYSGRMVAGQLEHDVEFHAIAGDLEAVPAGSVISLSEQYLKELLVIVGACFRDFDVYVDPRALFTRRALDVLHWSVDDLEAAIGLPRGWTAIGSEGPIPEDARLEMLRRHGQGDTHLEEYLAKYGISL